MHLMPAAATPLGDEAVQRRRCTAAMGGGAGSEAGCSGVLGFGLDRFLTSGVYVRTVASGAQMRRGREES
jgi:hypothetical protein